MFIETFTAKLVLTFCHPGRGPALSLIKLVLVDREKYSSFWPFPLYLSSISTFFPPSPLVSTKNRTGHLEERWIGVHQGRKQDKRH